MVQSREISEIIRSGTTHSLDIWNFLLNISPWESIFILTNTATAVAQQHFLPLRCQVDDITRRKLKLHSLYSVSVTLLKKTLWILFIWKTYCLILKESYSLLETKPQRQKTRKAPSCSVLPDCTAGKLKQIFQSISVLVS